MATVNVLGTQSKQSRSGLKATLEYCMRDDKTMYQGRKLVAGINCLPESAYTDMMNTKSMYGKDSGRMYYHLDQSFSPDEKITPDLAHEIAVRFASEQFKGYEVVVSTHVDANHLHSHFVVNSVSIENGKKYHSGNDNIYKLRDESDKLCRAYGLSVVETDTTNKNSSYLSTREYRSAEKLQSWKMELALTIDSSMKYAASKEDFISIMESEGYKVKWTDERKSITYTTPNGMKCRDIKLHENKYRKEEMAYEFNIRQEILRRTQKYGKPKESDGVRLNTMCGGNGSQLEGVVGNTGNNNKYDRADIGTAMLGGQRRQSGENIDTISRIAGKDERRYRIHDENNYCGIERRNESNEEFNREDLYQYRETGWEPEREMFIRAVFREESVKTTYEPNYIGSTITIGDIAVAGVGIATGLMLSDSYSNDPERRKKEIEEMQQAESVGVVLGVAIGLGYKLYQKYKADDTTDDEDNGEENVPVMMGM